MIGKKEVIVFLIGFAFFIMDLHSVSSVSVSLTSLNSTLTQVRIDDAVNLYGYEVNMLYSNTIDNVRQYNFLTLVSGDSTYGYSTRDSILSVYGSRLDAQKQGVSGSGNLFNITHSDGTLSLSSVLFIFNDSTEQEIFYGGDSGSSGSSESEDESVQSDSTVVFDKERFNVNVKQGESKRENLTIENLGDNTAVLDFGISLLANYILLDKESLSISPGGRETLYLDFFTSTSSSPGVYTGKLLVYKGIALINSVNIIFEVEERLPLFDISSIIDANEYLMGDSLATRITMINIGDLEKADVVLRYSIKDFDGNEYLLREETVGVEGTLEITRIFAIPSFLSYGDYVFATKLTTVKGGQIATSANPFSIVEGSRFDFFELRYYLIAGAVFVLLILIGIISYRDARKTKEKKHLRGHFLLGRKKR